jgi:perosamine synthetase
MTHELPALLGGSPALPRALRAYSSIGPDEIAAVTRVAASGTLSGFYGSWGDEFLGGPVVKQFEAAWSKQFGAKHAVSVNSNTSGLIAAMGAIGVTPGTEVIVPPYTMSATALAPLFYGGIPVFADIDPETFTLDPAAVRRAITPRTRAILAVNLFGHPARLGELRRIADEHGLRLVEDNAQAPFAREDGRYTGSVGDIGVYSLNYHKHIHTGEGGVCVTQDDELARRLQMIRNHAENIVEPLGIEDPTNLLGYNFRMTELSAAVGLAQLCHADRHIGRRVALARALTEASRGLEGLTPAVVREGCEHAYYVWTLRVDAAALGLTRAQFSEALAAEGFPHFNGYVRPLYLLPVFQKRIAFGGGYPFSLSDVRYPAGLCPVAERMWRSELLCFEVCAYDVDERDLDDLRHALRKVHAHRRALAAHFADRAEAAQ